MGKTPKNLAGAAGTPPFPPAEVYSRLESAAILALLTVFIGLFIWLTYRGDQEIYQYYVFALMSTLMFCGVLKSVGAFRKAGVALGGSIVVFGAFFWITNKTFENYNNQKKLIEGLGSKTTALTNDRDQHKAKHDLVDAQLKELLNQDIAIYTFRIDQTPLREVLVQYFSENGEPRDAKRDGIRHVVPIKELLTGAALRVVYDGASLPAQTREAPDLRITRLTYRIRPLELRLFLLDQ